MKKFSIIIRGKAGNGVETVGTLLAKAAAAYGRHFFLNSEIHSVIKGAMNSYQLTLADEPVNNHAGEADCLMDLESGELTCAGKTYDVPFHGLAKQSGGRENVVGYGLAAFILGASEDISIGILSEHLGRKGDEVVRVSIEACKAGFGHAAGILTSPVYDLGRNAVGSSSAGVLCSGSMAAAQGALAAGCRFFAAYPMTPSTGVLHHLAKQARQTDIRVRQAEDELAAICMAIGAGYAGARAMTATSGGGYALMSEAIGMAGMAEIPVVIIDAQRPGPSTGLPTRTGQGDLRQVLHAGQGDFPHIVLAPATIAETFEMVRRAFDLAERYRCPVTVLTDKYLMESSTDFAPPQIVSDAGSGDANPETRILPGTPGERRLTTTYEHDEHGRFTEEAATVSRMNERRMSKMLRAQADIPGIRTEDQMLAEATLVCWGSTYGAACEAAQIFKEKGIAVDVLCPRYLRPLPLDFGEALLAVKNPILIEGNITGQLGGWLRENYGLDIEHRILDYSGRPFSAQDIVSRSADFIG